MKNNTTDYLGSILAITNSAGSLVEQRQFGAWGTVDYFSKGLQASEFTHVNTLLPRGNTGHEHFFGVGLIHMNGRMYDQNLGRFLSPDDHIQEPFNTQSFNRYGYVWNNPLSGIDPDGETVLTKYKDQDGNLIAETNDGNDGTVIVENNKVEDFTNSLNSYGMLSNSVMANQELIRNFGAGFFGFEGDNIQDWATEAFSNSKVGLAGIGLSISDLGSEFAQEVLSGSTLRLFKGGRFSPKLYTSGWGGGSRGRIKTHGTSGLSRVLNATGKGLGLYTAYSIHKQYKQGQINIYQYGLNQGSNALSTLGGIWGAAWGIGWESGRAITNISGYHQNVRAPIQRTLGLID